MPAIVEVVAEEVEVRVACLVDLTNSNLQPVSCATNHARWADGSVVISKQAGGKCEAARVLERNLFLFCSETNCMT